jgi:hypothetical protein
MKYLLTTAISLVLCAACQTGQNKSETQHMTDNSARNPIEGTWQLVSGTLIEKGDTTVTDYTRNISMIKVINATHFSFLNHDLKKGTDSTASFSAGGGRYTLSGDQYTEHLEYCNYREWEGHTFPFTVTIKGDSLIQQGVEKIEDLGVERLNIEKYVRVKTP